MQGDDQLNEFLSSFEFIQPPSKVKLDTGSICIYIHCIYVVFYLDSELLTSDIFRSLYHMFLQPDFRCVFAGFPAPKTAQKGDARDPLPSSRRSDAHRPHPPGTKNSNCSDPRKIKYKFNLL